VFVNTSEPLAAGPPSVGVNGPSGPVANTNIKVDDSIAALFGYMPYDDTKGYQLFPANTAGQSLQIRCAATAQIFAPADFPALLQGLWQSAGGSPGQHPAIYGQKLVLQQNALFNIRGGRTVKVMWFYLNPIADWKKLLASDVAGLLDGPGFENFPNYSTTMDTELTVPQYTLLANLTAWTVTRALGPRTLADFLQQDNV
jgi:hypothetical protein